MKKLVITAVLSGMILISLIVVYFVTSYVPKTQAITPASKLQEYQSQQVQTSQPLSKN